MKLITTTYEMHTHTHTHTVEQLNNKCADSSKWPYSPAYKSSTATHHTMYSKNVLFNIPEFMECMGNPWESFNLSPYVIPFYLVSQDA